MPTSPVALAPPPRRWRRRCPAAASPRRATPSPGRAAAGVRAAGLAWLGRCALAAAWLLPATALAADPARPLRVVATLPGLAALAHEVGRSWVAVDSLASHAEDPHFVDARPNLAVAINRADLLISNGFELEEGWLPPLLKMARNPRVLPGRPGHLEAAGLVTALEVPTGRLDRGMGDLHAGGNPHFLNAPGPLTAVAMGVAAQLAQLDPPHAADYRANSLVLARALGELGRRQRARFDRLPAAAKRVVAYHKSLAYLFAWLGLEEVGTFEPQPGVAPSPKHVVGLIHRARAMAARMVVQESYYPDRGTHVLAEKADMRLVVLPGAVHFERHQGLLVYLEAIADSLYAAASPAAAQPAADPPLGGSTGLFVPAACEPMAPGRPGASSG